jgi:hypothetical protein
MLSLLFGYLKTAALFFLLNDYFKRNYPYDYEMVYIQVTYNIINMYSRCQLICKNGIQYIREKYPDLVTFIEKFNKNDDSNNTNNLQFIKNSSIIKLRSKNEYLNNDEIIVTDCDFVIYFDYKQNSRNIKIITDVNLLDKKETYQYEVTDYKFLLVELIFNTQIYKITLSTDSYNFYVVDNILDEKFFLYYLRYYLPDRKNGDFENPEMFVKIIDHNVNSKMIELKTEYIQLGKTDYKIINKD